MVKLTKHNQNYWANRKINWDDSYFTPDHPHRILILKELVRFPFKSVFELGCGAGANLYKIYHTFKGAEVGGTDINPEAIECAKRHCPFAKDLEVGNGDDFFFSDKSIDVVITDAALIYFDPFKVDKIMKEIIRVARNGVVFCELWHPSTLQRIKLFFKEGYTAHNYEKLLKKHGFYDIRITKIPEKFWPDSLWTTYGFIISAKC